MRPPAGQIKDGPRIGATLSQFGVSVRLDHSTNWVRARGDHVVGEVGGRLEIWRRGNMAGNARTYTLVGLQA